MNKSRIDWAKTHNNEKHGGEAVSKDWLLCNSIGTLKLNGREFSGLPDGCSGLMLDWREIHSVEHPMIVMVENLSVMAALDQIDWPEELANALFVFRGMARDVQTSSAYHFCRQAQIPVIVFADFDPKGIEIAFTSGAKKALVPVRSIWDEICHKDWKSLIGPEYRWSDQEDSRKLLEGSSGKATWIDEALLTMGRHGRTRTQEHLIAHEVPLALFPLN